MLSVAPSVIKKLNTSKIIACINLAKIFNKKALLIPQYTSRA